VDIPRRHMVRRLVHGTNGRRIRDWGEVLDILWCDDVVVVVRGRTRRWRWWCYCWSMIHVRRVFCRTCRRGGGCCIPAENNNHKIKME
jgi:hypothetical protein